MLLGFLVFLIGSTIGAFFAIWAEKGSLKAAFGTPARCKNCTKKLKGHHMVPIFGWFAVKGKCAHCKKYLPFAYVLFEAGFGLALLLVWLKCFWAFDLLVGYSLETWLLFARDLAFTMLLGLLVLFHIFHFKLPTRIALPFLVLILIVNMGIGESLPHMLIAAAAIAFFYWIQYMLSKGAWVGLGDIWMAAIVGSMLALPDSVLALLASYVLASFVAIIVLLSGGAHKHKALPMGVFLAFAAYGFLLLEFHVVSPFVL